MTAAALLIAAASLSVDYGWRQAEDGRLEYIIQVRPDQLADLERLPITSELPPEARQARRFVIQVGDKPLPRETIEVDEPIAKAAGSPAGQEARNEKSKDEAESDNALIVRGQSTADPYSQPAANQRYRGIQAGGPTFGGRVSTPTIQRQPAYVAQQGGAPSAPIRQPSAGYNPQQDVNRGYGVTGGVTGGAVNYGPAQGAPNYGAQLDEPQQANGAWRGIAAPSLDPPDRSQSFDSDLAVADRAYSYPRAPRQLSFSSSRAAADNGADDRANSTRASRASHDEELDDREKSSSRRDWNDDNAAKSSSSRGGANPWTITMMLLFASVGGNVWLGYLVWDLTQRFRDVVSDNRRRRRVTEAVDTANL